MGTDLTAYLKGGNVTVSDEAFVKNLERASDEGSTGSGAGVTYLNFSGKRGVYSLGKEREELTPDALFAMDPRMVFTGWQCWKGNAPIDKLKWSIHAPQNAVAEADLKDHGPYQERLGEGWKRMLGFLARELDGDRQIEFSTDSVSGRNTVTALLDEVRKRAIAGDPVCPIIGFDAEQFEAQGKANFKPKFLVETWTTADAIGCYLAGILKRDQLLDGKQPTRAQLSKLHKAPDAA